MNRLGFDANAVNFAVFAGQCLSSGKDGAAVMFWMTHCGLIEAKVIWWPRWFWGLRLASRMVVLQLIPRMISVCGR